jgi:hypothetical protein
MNRRHFISSVAVATPAVLIGEPRSLAQNAPASATDPVLVQLFADMQHAFTDAQSPETRAEGLAAFETSLRIWATYEAASGREARSVAAFRRRNKGSQRDALISAAMSKHDAFHEEIVKMIPGLDAMPPIHRAIGRDEFERGLNELTTNGYAAQLANAAGVLQSLRARAKGQQRVRFLREESCDDIRRAIAWAEVETGLMCAAAIFDPVIFGPACALSMVTLAMLQMTSWFACGI